MSNELFYYTPEGFDKQKKELKRLKIEERAKAGQDIADARSKGDLSENAEFDAAKEAQEMLEKKIAKLQHQLSHARIVKKEDLNTSKVSILSQVKLQNQTNQATLTYTLVPESEAELKEKKISVTSPIGKGLLGKKVGETATIHIPAGQIQFKILAIS